MCGFNGIVIFKSDSEDYSRQIRRMNGAISHRGPDGEGDWNDGSVFLGHRRLSIIDLSEQANQPMHSFDNRFVIVFNGEIYNFRDLRFELQRAAAGEKPFIFKTNSDTEVLLAGFQRWGKDVLNKLNGMFSFAIYDKENKKVFIARDRYGVKPLYFSQQENLFVFSSEIRSILQSGLVPDYLNGDAIVDYLRYQTVQYPLTIIKEISSLEPGHYIEINSGVVKKDVWYAPDKRIHKIADEHPDTVKRNVRDLFFKSVERRLISDVPFGAFLSGGIDSSAIVAGMHEVKAEKISTFNISFDESEFSESAYARQIATKFNTDHHEIRLTPADFLKQLPDAILSMDHPGGDGLNTYVVSKATRAAGITMALSGIGGDELFCGYDIFKRSYELERKRWLNFIPRVFRILLGELMYSGKRVSNEKIKLILSKPSLSFEYYYPVGRLLYTDPIIRGLTGKDELPINSAYRTVRSLLVPDKNHFLSRVSLAEISTYMSNTLLRDADQMSMACGLETREPFLDFELAEYVLSLPDDLKFPNTPKKLLVESLGDLLPDSIVNRPKMGFMFPWELWLKKELKNYAEDGLAHLAGIVNPDVVTALKERFYKGDPLIRWSHLWPLVVLGHWIKNNNLSGEVR